jgi:hypothetical protein
VRVVPLIVYVEGSCVTPDTITITALTDAGAIDIVKAVVLALPVKVSLGKSVDTIGLPMYAIMYSL